MMPETPVLHAVSPLAAGRTVREVVETAPASVTDAWCRQLIAHLLRAVEMRHSLQRPHGIIMPDTVLVQADGAAELLAPLDDDDAAFQPPVAADLKAIAAVAHFAISGESPPAAALLPRGLPAFSDGLLQAIDACLYGDRNRRPQSVDDMRRLLDMPVVAVPQDEPQLVPAPHRHAPQEAPAEPRQASVADELEQAIAGLAAAVGVEVEPAAKPAAAAAAPEIVADIVPDTVPKEPPTPAQQTPPPPLARKRTPWLLVACLAAGILGAAGFALYEKGRQAGAEAVLAATPPPAEAAVPGTPAATVPAAAPAAVPAPAAPSPATDAVIDPAINPATVSRPPTAVAAKPVAPAGRAAVTYQLRIKPWGDIYVDGVRRGISPPLKTLTLTGEHSVRIDNPDFPSHEIIVGAGQDTSTRIDYDFR